MENACPAAHDHQTEVRVEVDTYRELQVADTQVDRSSLTLTDDQGHLFVLPTRYLNRWCYDQGRTFGGKR